MWEENVIQKHSANIIIPDTPEVILLHILAAVNKKACCGV